MVILLRNSNNDEPELAETPRFSEDLDSTCSTPYVSAPSSPGREPPTSGYFFSAPASPMHYVLSSTSSSAMFHPSESSFLSIQSDFEFEFSSRFSSHGSVAVGSMSSADELFLNGQIRPMKLSSHLQRPQVLAPLIDLDGEEDDIVDKEDGDETVKRGRDLKLRSRSLHRKARSLSPLRNGEFEWHEEDIVVNTGGSQISEKILELQDYVENKESGNVSSETTPSCSASSSRSSSSGRNSKKWIFLKDLLYRSKSEGRGNGIEKFWSSISFSPKEKKLASPVTTLFKEDNETPEKQQPKQKQEQKQKQKRDEQVSVKKRATGKPANGISKRRVPQSAHELHYTANRAQSEEMKKRTYLPYRQGLFGCLGFSSKGYGALNGLARTFRNT